MKHLILDFAGVSSSGKTTVINGIVEELQKGVAKYGTINVVPSISRLVAELSGKTSESTSVFSQAYISLNNFVNVLESALNFTITFTTDLGIRSTAYLMGIEPLVGSVDRVLSDKLISSQLSFVKMLTGCDSFEILHFYLPLEIPVVEDGIRSTNPYYHKKIEGYIRDIYRELNITPFVLTGSERARKEYALCLLNEYSYRIKK